MHGPGGEERHPGMEDVEVPAHLGELGFEQPDLGLEHRLGR
jgi:hypothetical protein